MPAFLNWLLRLLPTNPICMRLVQGGSCRLRHMYLRSGYLGVMIVILLFAMLANVQGSMSVRQLAAGAANTFVLISYLQVGLICLLTPIFMAGAIAQESNRWTWDILLTTPLNSLQIVLGNLFGRLFFILALLFSTLPLFAVTQYFGGVPGESIFASYAIAGASSLLVAAIAVTMSVTRTGGRKAVFWFYASVVMFLYATYAGDGMLRAPIALGAAATYTTVLTPVNPFLALEVLLKSNTYVPHDFTGVEVSWLMRIWYAQPITTFCWLCIGLSVVMIGYSTIRLRAIGAKVGALPWYRRMLGLAAPGAVERPARHVGTNPIAWRESVARGKTLPAIVARWGFVAIGVTIGLTLIGLYHAGVWTKPDLQTAVAAVLSAEVVIIALIALNMSATAVTREREDGTLDLILTTPLQPGPYLAGKLRGLIQYLLPLLLVPTITLALLAVYVLADGFGNPNGTVLTGVPVKDSTATIDVPLVLPEGAILLPLVLVPFVAVCVMIGLYWSIKSKGTIGSVVGAVAVAGAASGVLGLCAMATGNSMPVIGAVVTTLSPVNLIWALVYPADTISGSVASGLGTGRISMLVGAILAAVVYGFIVYMAHNMIKRSFMMTVRRLAGVS
ncbi:MAG: ABC transporter permease subunit [Planctomycetes bacterium]|nr:ABC transporter permease subunit [Planctomycetota bacterium]